MNKIRNDRLKHARAMGYYNNHRNIDISSIPKTSIYSFDLEMREAYKEGWEEAQAARKSTQAPQSSRTFNIDDVMDRLNNLHMKIDAIGVLLREDNTEDVYQTHSYIDSMTFSNRIKDASMLEFTEEAFNKAICALFPLQTSDKGDKQS